MGEKTDWKTPVIVIVAVVVVAIIIFMIMQGGFSKKVELEPLTDEDFKIISIGWNEYSMEYKNDGIELVPKIPKAKINWDSDCNYCLTGNLGTQDYSGIVDEEIRCNRWEANFLLQSSKNLSGNFIINGVKDESLNGVNDESNRWRYSNGIYLRGIPFGLEINKNNDIVFCAIDSDLHWVEQEPICKAVTLPAKCSTK